MLPRPKGFPHFWESVVSCSVPPVMARGRGLLRPPRAHRSGHFAIRPHGISRTAASTRCPLSSRQCRGVGAGGHNDRLGAAAAHPFPLGTSARFPPGRLWAGLVTRRGQRPAPGEHRGVCVRGGWRGGALPGQSRVATGGLSPAPHGPQRPFARFSTPPHPVSPRGGSPPRPDSHPYLARPGPDP